MAVIYGLGDAAVTFQGAFCIYPPASYLKDENNSRQTGVVLPVHEAQVRRALRK
jgi:hypothetical protein